jgi:hypothetical protein
VNDFNQSFQIKIYLFFSIVNLGGLHSNDGTNSSIELEEEIVFKHAIYISNQLKATSLHNQALNSPSHFPTLLHKLVRLNNLNQIKAIKKSKLKP